MHGIFFGILEKQFHLAGLRRLAGDPYARGQWLAMMATIHQTRGVKPEERELAHKQREQERLEAELAECELRLASLRGELGALEHRYLKSVGLPYAELDELRAQIAERMVAQDPSNERLQRAAREARARANESRSAAPAKDAEETRQFSPSLEIKRLYREVAKRIHPDLTADANDRARRQELMAEANQAYHKCDQTRLGRILETYESSPESVQGDGAGAELIRVIRKLSQMKNRLGEIETEAGQLVHTDLYMLKIQANDAQAQGRDLLAEMAEKVKMRITNAKERLEALAPEGVR